MVFRGRFADEDLDDFDNRRGRKSNNLRRQPRVEPFYDAVVSEGPKFPHTNESTRRPIPERIVQVLSDATSERARVKFFKHDKGFGFVETFGPKPANLFIHISALKPHGIIEVTEGMTMTIVRGPGKNPGTEAVKTVISVDQ